MFGHESFRKACHKVFIEQKLSYYYNIYAHQNVYRVYFNQMKLSRLEFYVGRIQHRC